MVTGIQERLNRACEVKSPLKALTNPEHDSYVISEKSRGIEAIRLHIDCDVRDGLSDCTCESKVLRKSCVADSSRCIIAVQMKEPEMTVTYYISSAD